MVAAIATGPRSHSLLWGVDPSDESFRHCVIRLNIVNFVQSRSTIAHVRVRSTIARVRTRSKIALFIWHKRRIFEIGSDNFPHPFWHNLSVAILAQAF
jgi:hypothetical protein